MFRGFARHLSLVCGPHRGPHRPFGCHRPFGHPHGRFPFGMGMFGGMMGAMFARNMFMGRMLASMFPFLGMMGGCGCMDDCCCGMDEFVPHGGCCGGGCCSPSPAPCHCGPKPPCPPPPPPK